MWPDMYKVVSQPIRAWKGIRACNEFVGKRQATSCIGIYFCFLNVPDFIHNSLHAFGESVISELLEHRYLLEKL